MHSATHPLNGLKAQSFSYHNSTGTIITQNNKCLDVWNTAGPRTAPAFTLNSAVLGLGPFGGSGYGARFLQLFALD
jgi:hypothetical protein